MTHSPVDDEVRYGYQEGQLDDAEVNPEIQYPNVGDAQPGGPGLRSPMRENPSDYYVRGLPKDSPISDIWAVQTVQLAQGSAPQFLIAKNKKRSRLVIWTDSNNGGNVFLSNNRSGATGSGSGSVALGPGSAFPIEMRHTGEVFAWCPTNSGCVVYFYEESLAQ